MEVLVFLAAFTLFLLESIIVYNWPGLYHVLVDRLEKCSRPAVAIAALLCLWLANFIFGVALQMESVQWQYLSCLIAVPLFISGLILAGTACSSKAFQLWIREKIYDIAPARVKAKAARSLVTNTIVIVITIALFNSWD